MYQSPDMHLAITRDRHSDLLREARNRELARLATADRPGLLSRLRERFAAAGTKQPEPRAAQS
jgi:hypothetical protein